MTVDYKEIIRLHALGYSNVEVAGHTKVSRNTVHDVLKMADDHHISEAAAAEMSNEDIYRAFFPEKARMESLRLEPSFEYMYGELAKKGVNLSLLWAEYCEQAKNVGKIPYMRSQFCDLYRVWAGRTKATMRISHKPGDAVEVDWSGGTIPLYDQADMKVRKVPLFVAVLSCSKYVYAEPCLDTKTDNWILAHIHALEYFGGIPRLLVPDNTKTATVKNTANELILNKSYTEMADYYGMAIVPARVEHPDDKPDAEGSVKFATTWIIAALRNEKFTSFEAMKEGVAAKLEELNHRAFANRPGCRRDAYDNEERSFMRPLPAEPYDPAVWIPEVKVPRTYLISDGLNRYSVPYTKIGHTVSVRLTRNLVEVYEKGELIAAHPRLKAAQADPVVNLDHMTEDHRKYLKYNEEQFRAWADTAGPATRKTVDYFLDNSLFQKTHAAEQGNKYCYRLLHLADQYGTERLEKACALLLNITDQPTLRNLSTILKNGRDKAKTDTAVHNNEDHGNIGLTRGAEHYRNINGDKHD